MLNNPKTGFHPAAILSGVVPVQQVAAQSAAVGGNVLFHVCAPPLPTVFRRRFSCKGDGLPGAMGFSPFYRMWS